MADSPARLSGEIFNLPVPSPNNGALQFVFTAGNSLLWARILAPLCGGVNAG
jgi:hypothetical protein